MGLTFALIWPTPCECDHGCLQLMAMQEKDRLLNLGTWSHESCLGSKVKRVENQDVWFVDKRIHAFDCLKVLFPLSVASICHLIIRALYPPLPSTVAPSAINLPRGLDHPSTPGVLDTRTEKNVPSP